MLRESLRKKFSEAQKERFKKQLSHAKDNDQIEAKEYRSMLKQFTKNQAKLKFYSKKYD